MLDNHATIFQLAYNSELRNASWKFHSIMKHLDLTFSAMVASCSIKEVYATAMRENLNFWDQIGQPAKSKLAYVVLSFSSCA